MYIYIYLFIYTYTYKCTNSHLLLDLQLQVDILHLVNFACKTCQKTRQTRPMVSPAFLNRQHHGLANVVMLSAADSCPAINSRNGT